jgi:chromosome segregation ATPase
MREPVFLLALAIAAMTAIVVVRTIVGAFTGRSSSRAELGQLREQLDQHSAALEDAESALANQSAQIAELQERLDFTERLLTQGRDRVELRPGDPR